MAAIDKIYGSRKNWIDLWDFLHDHKPQYIKKMHSIPEKYSRDSKIAHFDDWENKWLIENCPLKFVRKRLIEQYGEVVEIEIKE